MGLFSSQKVTVVSTTVHRCIDDDRLPDSIKTGVIKSIFENGEVSEYVAEELAHSVGNKAERMFEYGKRGYMFGNPTSTVVSPVKGNGLIRAYLERLAGTSINTHYMRFSPMNWYHNAFTELATKYGYNIATNKVTFKPPGLQKPEYEVYLHSMVAHVHQSTVDANLQNNTLDIFGEDPNSMITPGRFTNSTFGLGDQTWERKPAIAIIPESELEYVAVTLVWEHTYYDQTAQAQIIEYPQYTFNVSDSWVPGEYYQVLYTPANGVPVFWSYLNGSGNAELDAIFYTKEPDNKAGSFFPYVYFRFDKTNPYDKENGKSEEVKQSKKMCKYLGLSHKDITEAIHENPDKKDIESAMMVMAVPANTEEPIEQRYLFEFFDQILLMNDFPNPLFVGVSQTNWNSDKAPAKRSIIIEDKRFKIGLGFNYLKKIGVEGNEPVGTFKSGMDFDVHKFRVTSHDGAEITYEQRIRYFWYRKQIAPGMCSEIRVSNLKMTYYVWGNHTDVANDEEENLLIPIDRSITRKYSMRMRETLYSRSLHFLINARQVIKLKWYQREWFQIFMIIVAVVISVWSLGTAANGAFALVAASGWAAAIQAMALSFLKYLASLVAINLFVKTVGGEVAMIIAVVALAYGVYNGGSVIGNVAQGAATWANNLIQLASSLIKGVGDFYGDAIAKISEEMKSLQDQYNKDLVLLDDAKDLLEQQTILSPLTIFGETPDQYFARTVRSGNIGTVALEFPRTFVEQALTLPDLIQIPNLGEA